jgi:hypothetical protein
LKKQPMSTPVPSKLASIPAFKDLNITNASNVGESKPSLLVLGDMKTGKTHFWCTFPGPIVCWCTDTNPQTANGFIRGGADIELIENQSWDDYRNKFIPAVKNRLIDAKTIVVDSYSSLSDSMVRSIAGPDGKVTIPQWGQIKNQHANTMMDLASATQPIPGKPSYNIIVTCHLMKDGSEESDGAMVPAIPGGFKYEIGKAMGTVLITRKLTRTEKAPPGHPLEGRLIPTDPINVMYSVPPDDRHACGDGVGGKGGFDTLPTVLGNTYSDLMKGWGQKQEPTGSKESN